MANAFETPVFDVLSANIDHAQAEGKLDDYAALILQGRILHAVDRGDLELDQAERLEARLNGVRERYADAFDVASYEAAL